MKTKNVYICSSCGTEHMKWTGQCTGCQEWNTLEERIKNPEPKNVLARESKKGYAGGLSLNIETINTISNTFHERTDTGLNEFNRVLGGGIVKASSTLIAGDPGAGKSTLLLQVASHLSQNKKVLYCSGEESLSQIKDRFIRLEITKYNDENFGIVAETDLMKIIDHCHFFKPDLLIIDSLQSIYNPNLESQPGSISQVKDCLTNLNRFIKDSKKISMFVVCHITKNETLAGPKSLEHVVDTVLMLSSNEDEKYRIMRTDKNRFGSTSEIGIFEMTEKGLTEVENVSSMFISENTNNLGCVVSPLWEGSRPLFVEIQALVVDTSLGNPRRYAVGIDNNRLAMILGVIAKHLSIPIFTQDVYVNVVGGIKINQTSTDLAMLIAIYGSYLNIILPEKTIILGEVDLSGRIRPNMYMSERIKEAKKIGFEKVIAPKEAKDVPGIEIIRVSNIIETITWIAENGKKAK